MPKILNYSDLIQESEEELLLLEKAQQKSYLRDRLRFLRFLKTGIVKTQEEAASLISLSFRQGKNLWSKYKEQGITYFSQPRVNQNWGKLSSVQIAQLLQYLDQDQAKTQKEIQHYIKASFGKDFTQAGIHYLFKRLKVKLKTGRPSNVRKDEAGALAFKKST